MRPFAGGQAAAQGTGGRAVCLLGIPDDTGVAMNKGRVGAKGGPGAFRAALTGYGLAQPVLSRRAMPAVFDAGDIVPGATLDETHARATEASRAITLAGLLPVAIGGGHDLTFAFVRGVIEGLQAGTPNHAAPPRAGLYVDAHLDVRAEAGSGMPFRALVERCGVRSLVCIGMEPLVNSAEHAAWFAAHGGRAVSVREARAADPATLVPRESCFVSIDLDGLDAAHAPGVSATNPCGLDPQTVAGIALAAGRSPHAGCFDICELNPAFDMDGRTARLAAYLFLSFLAGLAERPA